MRDDDLKQKHTVVIEIDADGVIRWVQLVGPGEMHITRADGGQAETRTAENAFATVRCETPGSALYALREKAKVADRLLEERKDIDRLRKENGDMQMILHDLIEEGGRDMFEAGRRAGLGEAIALMKRRSNELRSDGFPEGSGIIDELTELTEAIADRLIPHPPHELAGRLAEAEARIRELEEVALNYDDPVD